MRLMYNQSPVFPDSLQKNRTHFLSNRPCTGVRKHVTLHFHQDTDNNYLDLLTIYIYNETYEKEFNLPFCFYLLNDVVHSLRR